MSDDNPEIEELDFQLELAAEKMNTIFEVVFEISEYDAEMLLNLWDDATLGDLDAVYALMGEVKKLIDVLREEVDGV
tara:strand:- start:5090 stop:5320 length:231 start_codon:yes stop_codon:yes gene_type:complete